MAPAGALAGVWARACGEGAEDLAAGALEVEESGHGVEEDENQDLLPKVIQ